MMETAGKTPDNAALLRQLAVTMAKHKSDTGVDIAKNSGNAAPFTYATTTTLAKGYYLVVDTQPDATAALTFPILKVVGPVKVNSKSSVPESDKDKPADAEPENRYATGSTL